MWSLINNFIGQWSYLTVKFISKSAFLSVRDVANIGLNFTMLVEAKTDFQSREGLR